jgi:hypothetical protein
MYTIRVTRICGGGEREREKEKGSDADEITKQS